jgi:hypothetical protein
LPNSIRSHGRFSRNYQLACSPRANPEFMAQ